MNDHLKAPPIPKSNPVQSPHPIGEHQEGLKEAVQPLPEGEPPFVQRVGLRLEVQGLIKVPGEDGRRLGRMQHLSCKERAAGTSDIDGFCHSKRCMGCMGGRVALKDFSS